MPAARLRRPVLAAARNRLGQRVLHPSSPAPVAGRGPRTSATRFGSV